jgi:hypothetical protein
MIARVAGPSVPLAIGSALFLVVAGLVIWLYSRRKGDRYTGWLLFVGLPGLYLAGLASLGAPEWLYIPGLGLLASSYLMQIVIWRRQRAGRDAAPPDSNGPA